MNPSPGRIPFSRWLMASLLLLALQLLVDINFSFAKEPTKKAPKKATAAAVDSSLPRDLMKIEQAYQKSATLEAKFTQVSHVALTGAKKETSGVVSVKRPNKFRWETLQPERNLLVSNGLKYWFYTPPFEEGERGQVVEKRSKEVQSELANQLLSGAFSKMKTTQIKEVGPHRYQLTPAAGSAGTVKTAEVEIDPKKSLIRKVKLLHEGGNVVEINLSDVKLGAKIDEGLFSFVTPPGTDVIRE